MKILKFRDFMRKHNLKIDTKIESQSQKNYNSPIYPRDSKIYSDKRLVKIEDGEPNGTHWTCLIVKDKKS